VLIQVRAAGINFAELEQTLGRYPFTRPLPGVLGFEAAGEVVELGEGVNTLQIGDRIVAPVSSGGYAEYATANANFALPVPEGITFAQATSIVIQGISAYALLKLAAKPGPDETVLIQAAAGGVGLYLVQLARIMDVGKIIALASSQEKLDLVTTLGADVAIDYSLDGWTERVLDQTGGKGVDVVLEMASGDIRRGQRRAARPIQTLRDVRRKERAGYVGAKADPATHPQQSDSCRLQLPLT
jgi:NADPH2:quinone reductase